MSDIALPGAGQAIEATVVAKAIREKNLSAVELMQATLKRIKAVNSTLNAVVSLRDDDDLLKEAEVSDGQAQTGPLKGVPIAIKDLADAKGLPTSQGSTAFAGTIAAQDSPHVARLRAAGAIVIGKTNTPEFGLGSHTYNPVHGATCNPYDPSVSCGGSSGGAAVALATGMLSIADGSDMMGSLRNPAGWNNVYGLRPSWGRVAGSGSGEIFLHRISTNGPMARTPSDLSLMLDVMSGPAPLSPYGQRFAPTGHLTPHVKGKRIAWLGDWGGAYAVEAGILPLCETALTAFEVQGADVEPIAAPFDRDMLWQSWTCLRSWAIASETGALLDNPETAAQLKPEAIWEIEQGRALDLADVERASAIRSDWYRAASQLLQHYDALALPTAQVWPFAMSQTWPKSIAGQSMDTYHRWMEVMIPASLIGLPALAVPAGLSATGLPMGVQLIGATGADTTLLALAEGYHRAVEPLKAWPIGY